LPTPLQVGSTNIMLPLSDSAVSTKNPDCVLFAPFVGCRLICQFPESGPKLGSVTDEEDLLDPHPVENKANNNKIANVAFITGIP